MAGRLDGRRILIMETREEAQFSRLLSDQGADVMQCPMFTIEDAPDPQTVEDWIARAITEPCDDLVLMTGEGLRRILKVARRLARDAAFVAALQGVRTICRGPKPGRALREIGLAAHVTTQMPTTEGMIETLAGLDLKGHRVGVQLYPEKDHSALLDAIAAQGADVDDVSPYIYDNAAAASRIGDAIAAMAQGHIDALALTSSGQVRRLFDAARDAGREEMLHAALQRIPIASVGPVVSDELKAYGLQARIIPPEGAYFMKPLISAMATALA